MKKALSVLLIAAACFGFYGSAVTVNDLLACKDYWEEAGEKSTADMNKLEDGLNQLKDNEQAYLDGQDQLAEGEKTLADGEAQYAQGLKSYKSAPAKLAEGREGLAKLRAAIKGINDLKAASGYEKWKNGYHALHENRQKLVAGLGTPLESGYTLGQTLRGLASNLETEQQQKAYTAALDGINDDNQFADGYRNFATCAKTVAGVIDNMEKSLEGLLTAAQTFASLDEASLQGALASSKEYQTAAVKILVLAGNTQSDAMTMVGKAAAGDTVSLMTISGTAGNADVQKGITNNITSLKTLQGAYTDNLKVYAAAVDENIDTLDKGQNETIADGVKSLVSGILGDKTMKNKLIKKVGKAKVNSMKKYGTKNSPLYAKNGCDFAEFEKRMDTSPDVMTFLTKALPIVRARLAAGQKEYAAGLRDYKSAPGKLADAERQLADGRQQLADGKAQLAQYEDGEQQVRDGLATLFNTEPDLELESIADRLGGDGDFDNGDEHLDLDEGLNAVEVGRGYQADDGVLITNEIMGRAVATGGLIGAAVLAVLAAILSFLKKNKGAAVFALLAAAAGAFGAFYGPAQGTYFSDIAGSTVGTLTWVAAGVLGAVALVHAIVHFAAPKNA